MSITTPPPSSVASSVVAEWPARVGMVPPRCETRWREHFEQRPRIGRGPALDPVRGTPADPQRHRSRA
jgi:hypothetical protein